MQNVFYEVINSYYKTKCGTLMFKTVLSILQPPKRQYIRKKPKSSRLSSSDLETSPLGLLGDISDLADLDVPQAGTSAGYSGLASSAPGQFTGH